MNRFDHSAPANGPNGGGRPRGASAAAGPRRGKSAMAREANMTGWLFVSPMVLGFALLLIAPLVMAFSMSFTDWPLLGEAKFIGLDNYRALLVDSLFWKSLGNTFYFAAGLVPLNIALALSLALLLARNLPGMGIFRTAIFMPVVTSLIVWSIVWKYMFATDSGFINQLLQLVGIQGPAWLYNPKLAMPAVIVTSVLKNVGLNMVLFITALQQVPSHLYEAAKIDGASEYRIFWTIVMPLVKPAWLTLLILLLQTLWGSDGGSFIYSEELKTMHYALGQIVQGGIARAGAGAAVAVLMMSVPIVTFVVSQSKVIQTMAFSGMKD